MNLRSFSRVLVAACAVVLPCSAMAADAGGTVDFARDVAPIFAARCVDCHGPAKQKGGIRLDTHTALKGGDSGDPLLIAGKAAESHLIKLVKGEGDEVMPPKGDKLTAAQIEVLTKWINEGGKWPESSTPAKVERPKHWSFQKPVRPTAPAVTNGIVRNPIDAFILARLEKAGLKQSPEADKTALLRRVTFDLTGLPPTPEEVDAFLADTSNDAYEKVVDRLLKSPAFGERWARLWLDLARYADSKGYGSDPLRFTIHPYRDWVINAFNSNKPYDQFTIEQLAGDLLPNPTLDQRVATAFHRNTMTNTEGGTDDEEFRVAAVKDRTDVTFQVWMGLTMGCAQCHTHKFDPITNREYYQAYAFFNQSEDADRGDESPTIPTPTSDEINRQQNLQNEIATLEAGLKNSPEVAAAQAKWELALKHPEAGWKTLKVTSAKAKSGKATLSVQEDGSILAGGDRAKTDTYTIVAETDLAGITAFRIEALPDDTLPGKGPGRGEGGNFVLSELKVSTSPSKGENATPQFRGRYVRIEKQNSQHLMLAEVQVLAGSENLAPKGKASQSTTGFGGDAKRAIDGNTDGRYFEANSVSHTAEADKNPWWEVDLGEEKSFDRIGIWNRTDGGGAKIVGSRVVVMNANREHVFTQQITASPSPSLFVGNGKNNVITLSNASESFAQSSDGGWPASKAVDGDSSGRNGWAVAGGTGKRQVAFFEASGAPAKAGEKLTFTLDQNFDSTPLGRFRISATTRAKPVRIVPNDIAAILATDASKRSDAQRLQVRDYFLANSNVVTKDHSKLADLRKQLASIKTTRTAIMQDLPENKRRPTHMLVKGNFMQKGEPVSPGVLAAFHPLPEGAPANRLGLAQWIASKENPLTARVQANRLWAAFFGTGLVETQEDFGEQGQPPSHPELLDWLATEFMQPSAAGVASWDMKHLMKLIVTSATYRQSSRVLPEHVEKDARNRLLARMPRQRLEAEMVRDQALAVSGLLSRKMFGPSVYPPQPEGMWQAAFNGERSYPTSKGEDRYRRGLYTFWRRTVPYPSMQTFDAPSREVCTIRRIHTSTPLQAFVTMNDPVYVECSQALGRRLMKEGGATAEDRIRFGLRLILNRPPMDEQIKPLVKLYESELAHYKQNEADAKKLATEPIGDLPQGTNVAEGAAWTVVANVLLNLDGAMTR